MPMVGCTYGLKGRIRHRLPRVIGAFRNESRRVVDGLPIFAQLVHDVRGLLASPIAPLCKHHEIQVCTGIAFEEVAEGQPLLWRGVERCPSGDVIMPIEVAPTIARGARVYIPTVRIPTVRYGAIVEWAMTDGG